MKRLTSVTIALMGLSMSAGTVAQGVPVGTCQPVAGQAEINGVMQQLQGTACLQPDGTWQMVDTDGTPVTYAGAPYYLDDTWYWGPPVLFGSVIFIDRFHHVHRMHNVFVHHGGRGGFHGGFHGGHGGGHGAGSHR